MAPETMTEEDLLTGKPLPTSSDLTLGEDFYDDDHDENDSRPRNQGDPISVAVGSPGFMAAHIVQECFETFDGGATTEPEEFDRYYFPPQVDGYDGPAPILIDILQADTPEELQQERVDKHVEFKTRWCAERGVRYVVLTDLEDLMLSAEALRAKLTGGKAQAAPAAQAPQEAPQAPRKRPTAASKGRRGVQHPRAES